MTALPAWRRLGLAVVAILVSAWTLRGPVAGGLVLRGDGCLYRAHPAAALGYYRRAIWFAPDEMLAVDRFAFVAMTLRDRAAMRVGIQLASAYLRRHPGDDVVRMDRAMAYRAAGDPADALPDFAEVGRRTNDARAFAFAGFAADSIGRRARARAFWHAALALVPGFPVAKHALARTSGVP